MIKKKRKADFLRGAVIALIITGLGAVLSPAKAQGERLTKRVCGVLDLSCARAMREELEQMSKHAECTHKIFLEHSREFKRTRGYKNPPLDYSKCNKYAPPRPATKKAKAPRDKVAVPRELPPRPARKKAKTKSIKFDPNKITAGIDDAVETRAKQRRKAAADQKKILNSLAKEQEERDRVIASVNNIRNQISKCWSIPKIPKARKGWPRTNRRIRIKVFLNIDGSLSKAPEILGNRPETGSAHWSGRVYDKVVESALMALLKCTPLKNMPADLYPRWREIILNFNPEQMIGG